MATNGTKLSFAFSGSVGAGPSRPSGQMSNMDLLMSKAKAPKVAAAPRKPVLGDDEDDLRLPSGSKTAASAKRPPRLEEIDDTSPPAGPSRVAISRAERRRQEEALRIDQSVFDYDGVYDGMKAAERKLDEVKKKDDVERKPKCVTTVFSVLDLTSRYIEAFLASAQTRKLDKLRAEEKMLQLEREKEGDEFQDKEKFVTEAYKKQMEDVRKAEEEERVREGGSKS